MDFIQFKQELYRKYKLRANFLTKVNVYVKIISVARALSLAQSKDERE